MTIGITPSSMQGKGGKRLNRNNPPIKNIFYKINYLPTRNPRTKAATLNIPCNSQFDSGRECEVNVGSGFGYCDLVSSIKKLADSPGETFRVLKEKEEHEFGEY